MCWEKMMMYFDSLLFKIVVVKALHWLEWVCTNYVPCPMTTLHRESWPRMWGRSQTWKWIHFFFVLFWGLKPNCLGIWGCVSAAAFSAERRKVRLSQSLLESGHSMDKRDRWSHLHRGTALEYYAVFVSTFCILKKYSKSKVKFHIHIKASSSIFVEFLGSHTLFPSTPCLIVWFVWGGTVGWGFSISFLLLVQLHLHKMFWSLSETQYTLKT